MINQIECIVRVEIRTQAKKQKYPLYHVGVFMKFNIISANFMILHFLRITLRSDSIRRGFRHLCGRSQVEHR